MSKEQATITVTLPPFNAEELMERAVEQLAGHLQKAVGSKLDEMVKARFDDGIRKAADKAVGEFLKKSLPKTNQWGEAKDGEITLTEYVIDQFKKHMEERVRHNGERADSYDKDKPTRHQWLIQQFGTEEIVKAAKAEVEKVRKTAEAQVSAAVGNFIAQNLVAPVTAHMIGKPQ